jgi:hypothetical protein
MRLVLETAAEADDRAILATLKLVRKMLGEIRIDEFDDAFMRPICNIGRVEAASA